MKCFLFLFLLFLNFDFLWARGGGGCFIEGTSILTPAGYNQIENLTENDIVLSQKGKIFSKSYVKSIYSAETLKYIELAACGKKIKVTPFHPFKIDEGVFKEAAFLKVSDKVYIEENGIKTCQISEIKTKKEKKKIYNLLVYPTGEFIADGFVVHNKGCFLPDTFILKSDKTSVKISEIKEGDKVLAFEKDGSLVTAKVNEIIEAEAEGYFEIVTDKTLVRVTAEHPFYIGAGIYKTAENIKEKDFIYLYDGSGLSRNIVVSIKRVKDRIKVYNLKTDYPNTFFANFIAVHNKGGCFPAGVKILTPSGEKNIEELKKYDEIYSFSGGKILKSKVKEFYIQKDNILEIYTENNKVLKTTQEHPVLTFFGFREAKELKIGDKIGFYDGGLKWLDVKKIEIREISQVYNLSVDYPNTFIADGFVVHNKGCFLPDTFILKSDKTSVKISEIKEGDKVLAFEKDGSLVTAKVNEIIEAEAEGYFEIVTDKTLVRVTAEHPFYIGAGIYKTAENIKEKDFIYLYDGSGLSRNIVVSIKRVKDRIKVYNLKTDYPNTFFANFIAVHNKGGFGGSRHYRSCTGDSCKGFEKFDWLIIAIFLIIFVARFYSHYEGEELDYIFPRSQIEKKSLKTEKLLNFIAKQDKNFEIAYLRKTISDTFMKLQSCWQARDYAPMKDLMMPHLYNQHERQLEIMRENHEINIMENLKILAIDFVGVRYTINKNGRFVTALITAEAADYYEDDRNNRFLRGSRQVETFQEFWIFKLEEDKWLLDKIEQTAESDALSKEDFFEQFTDEKVSEIYGEDISITGPVGPAMPALVSDKNVKIARMINFLGESDKMWNLSKMEIDASLCFIKVYEAWSKLDESKLSSEYIEPEMHKSLRDLIITKKNEGFTFEFRNLCIRKVDVVLINNRTEDREDEFVVRFSAHAQKKMIKSGTIIAEDEYVKPFVEYWLFGRCENKWRLKEIMSKGAGENALASENKDEEVSPMQLEWYYTKKRPY